MSKSSLSAYQALEAQLKEMSAKRDALANEVKPMVDARDKCVLIAQEANLPLPKLIELLQDLVKVEKKPRKPHAPRAVKVYKNPITGESIETKGGNHKTLKLWKAEHGSETVEGWRVNNAA